MPDQLATVELEPVDAPVAQTERPTSAQIAHLVFNPFGNPFLDRNFENDW